jgi:hypothetical protein
MLRGATDRPLLVGGCPRSGTTLLGSMLHSHPLLAIPPETRFALEGYRDRERFGDLRQEDRRAAFGTWVVSGETTRFANLGLDGDTVVAAIRQAPPTVGSLVGTVFAEFAAAHGKSRWGDKRPKYIEAMRSIFRMFPDAQFIHLVRDARGCTASLKQLGWWGYGTGGALARWQRSIEAGIEAREWCRPDQYLEVRYEDLVADPVPELRRICDYLGIDYDDEMVNHQAGAALINKAYHTRVAQPVDDKAVAKWRTVLTPEELALVEERVGHLLDEFGYARLSDLPPVPEDHVKRYEEVRAKQPWTTEPPFAMPHGTGYAPPLAARLTTTQRRLHRSLRARVSRAIR